VKQLVKQFVKVLFKSDESKPLLWKLFFCFELSKNFIKCVLKQNIYPKDGTQMGLPQVLQLPITNRCNLTCKMCGVSSCGMADMPIQDFEKAINSGLLKQITSVGINGGEPFIKSNIEEYVDIILTLPKLDSIFIISNGILTDKILEKLNVIYEKCKEKNIRLTVTFSIDGYKDIHDQIRGMAGAFDKTISTIKSVQSEQSKYCDNIGIICTISKYNIYNINELLAYAELNSLPKITYQLAVGHARLENENKFKEFSVMTDEYSRLLAQEFFFRLYSESGQIFYYYPIYRYIESGGTERLINCNWAFRDATIDASGNLYYCAVKSKSIGSIYSDKSLEESFFDKQNIKYRINLVNDNCCKCIHYWGNESSFLAYRRYLKYLLKNRTWRFDYIKRGRRL